MRKFGNGDYELTSGRQLRAIHGVIGLCEEDQEDSSLYGGFDEELTYSFEGRLYWNNGSLITKAERREIADHMIGLWDEWGGVW